MIAPWMRYSAVLLISVIPLQPQFEDTPIWIGDHDSLIVEPFYARQWTVDGKKMRSRSRPVEIRSVQLYQSDRSGDEEYRDERDLLCSAETANNCRTVEIVYSYKLGNADRHAILRLNRKYGRAEWTWEHRGHGVGFDFYVEPTPRTVKEPPRRRLLCREDYAMGVSGCPDGKVTAVKVNGNPVKIDPRPFHRVKIVFRGL